jgi:hypothetical protein
MSRDDPLLAPERRPATSGVERVVALALAAIALVLALALREIRRAPAGEPEEPFDFRNPMLSAQPGQCIEVSIDGVPHSAAWIAVRPEGVVLRPADVASIKGWINPRWPDVRVFPPYVLAEQRAAPGAPSASDDPTTRAETLVFPLDSLGFTLEQTVVLRGIERKKVSWNGQTRDAYVAYFQGYVDSEGPWSVYLSKDAPVLGVMRRDFVAPGGNVPMTHSFRVPESCR